LNKKTIFFIFLAYFNQFLKKRRKKCRIMTNPSRGRVNQEEEETIEKIGGARIGAGRRPSDGAAIRG
jgi:hypothetical protein